ncbi:MAG: 50S ribosomal protein L33 [Wolbachia endosymbiont of Armadillidium vulgare]|uniref:50S ribosomal protein L33 n=1 Tax=Wolbachia endosymbiont of Armadillidium vulgare TaxID=77039 RepID=UPI00064A3278|nr:50S ribosomal protein L33 [Wolbachia endosymbiont of Armadillidium vulgare]OJH31284.1 50S ribosomal protein L33 [Wolbachia endosymbiont of Armadillidium vulgare]OJH32405.1 50S ribosomal protein L33 [Wolbachia endosymbiont of Armadillidium vulgare]
MAKKNASLLVKLVSTANKITKTGEEKLTGYFYVKKRNPKKLSKKLEFRKYDPVVRRHVLFKEEKLK